MNDSAIDVRSPRSLRRRAARPSGEVPIRTFNDWNGPPPGFCEVDMVAHAAANGDVPASEAVDGCSADGENTIPVAKSESSP